MTRVTLSEESRWNDLRLSPALYGNRERQRERDATLAQSLGTTFPYCLQEFDNDVCLLVAISFLDNAMSLVRAVRICIVKL